MVKQYLLKTKQELLEKRIDCKKQLKKNVLSVKENMEFIHLIEESQDSSYNSFFPQSYRTVTNKEKIKKLKEEQREFEEKSQKIEKEIKDIDGKIEELNALIILCNQRNQGESNESESNESDLKEKVIKHDDLKLDIYKNIERENRNVMEQILDGTEVLNTVYNKMELSYKLMDMDPKRCKIELKNLINDLQEVTYHFSRLKYKIYPLIEENINLESAIYQYVDNIRKNNRIKISFKKRGRIKKLSDLLEQGVMRIIQIICDNMICRKANKIIIDLELPSEELILKIYCSLIESGKEEHYNFDEDEYIRIVHEIISIFSGFLEVNVSEENIVYIIKIPVLQ